MWEKESIQFYFGIARCFLLKSSHDEAGFLQLVDAGLLKKANHLTKFNGGTWKTEIPLAPASHMGLRGEYPKEGIKYLSCPLSKKSSLELGSQNLTGMTLLADWASPVSNGCYTPLPQRPSFESDTANF